MSNSYEPIRILVADEANAKSEDSGSIGSKFRNDIQGLRGLSILLVVCYHANFFHFGGFIGVDVFFVISGFVMMSQVVTNFDQGTEFSIANFLMRRVVRLIPLLTYVLGSTFIVCMLIYSPFGALPSIVRTFKFTGIFFTNFQLGKNSSYLELVLNPYRHLWSISAEIQMYVFFSILIVACQFFRDKSVKIMIFGALILFTLISGYLMFYVSSVITPSASQSRDLFFNPIYRFWEFGFGCLGSLSRSVVFRRTFRLGAFFSNLGGLLILVALFLIRSETGFPNPLVLIPIVGTTLILISDSVGKWNFASVLKSKFLVYVGDISYALYLWHWPMIVFSVVLFPGNKLAIVMAIGISFGLSIGLQKSVENRLRGHSSGLVNVGLRSLSLFSGMIIVFTLLSSVAIQTGFGLPKPNGTEIMVNGALRSECFSGPTQWGTSLSKCSNSILSSKGGIFLIGDSQAQAASDGLLVAGTSKRVQVIVQGRPACFFGTRFPRSQVNCGDYQKSWLTMIEAHRPQLVVIANRYDEYIGLNYANIQDDLRIPFADGSLPTNQSQGINSTLDSLFEMISKLNRLNIDVVVLNEVPRSSMGEPTLYCAFLGCRQGDFHFKENIRKEVSVQIKNRIGMGRNIISIDVESKRCQVPLICNPISLQEMDYFDSIHLNTSGSLKLIPIWKKIIEYFDIH